MADDFKRLTLTMRPEAFDAIRAAAEEAGVTEAMFAKRCIEIFLDLDPWTRRTFERFSVNFEVSLSLAFEHWGLAALARADARSEVEGETTGSMNALLADFGFERGEKVAEFRAVRGKKYFHRVLDAEIRRLVTERCDALLARHPALKLRADEVDFLATFREIIPAPVRREILLRLGDEETARAAAAEIEAEREAAIATADGLAGLATEARSTFPIPEGLKIADEMLGRLYGYFKDGTLSRESVIDQLEGMKRTQSKKKGGD